MTDLTPEELRQIERLAAEIEAEARRLHAIVPDWLEKPCPDCGLPMHKHAFTADDGLMCIR